MRGFSYASFIFYSLLLSEFVVSSITDQFFEANQFKNFGELAQNIKEFIDEVGQKKNQTMKIESLDDMQRAVENIPELKRISGNLSKHVTLSCEITKLVEERHLMTVSKAEQEISCRDDKKENLKVKGEAPDIFGRAIIEGWVGEGKQTS